MRLRGLDGLRAISISLVLFAHASADGRGQFTAELGVRVFFVISGFLITTLLLREREVAKRISLRGFYFRRAARIFPAFYAYIAVVVVLTLLGVFAVSGSDFAFAATYTMNFRDHRAWQLGHTWSLAVEEQFYLLWPLLLGRLGNERALRVAMFAVIVAPGLRFATLRQWPEIEGLLDQAFPFICDSIAIGCVLAIMRDRLEAWPPYLALLEASWFWLVPAAAIATILIPSATINITAAMTISNVGIALAIHRCIDNPPRFLENRFLVWIGTLSYSLYLWQQPFLNRHSTQWFCRRPFNLGIAVTLAIASYYLIEKPVRSWAMRATGRRFAQPG